MKWPFDKCRHWETDLSVLAAGALAREEHLAVEAHLQKCPACRARFAELQILATALSLQGQELPKIEPPASLRRRWIAGVRESKRDQNAGRPIGVPPSRHAALQTLHSLWRTLWGLEPNNVRARVAPAEPSAPALIGSARQRQGSTLPFVQRRLAWGGLAAIWVLTLFFRLSAPEASRPEVAADSPPSLREVVLVLKVGTSETRTAPEADKPQNQKPLPGAVLPRGQRPTGRSSEEWRLI